MEKYLQCNGVGGLLKYPLLYVPNNIKFSLMIFFVIAIVIIIIFWVGGLISNFYER